jgi:hypothetical protein
MAMDAYRMITLCEAIQRLSLSAMYLKRRGSNWLVLYREDKTEDNAHITDDLMDAVIEGQRMRMRRLRAI